MSYLYELHAFFVKCGLPYENDCVSEYIWTISDSIKRWDVNIEPSVAYIKYFESFCKGNCKMTKEKRFWCWDCKKSIEKIPKFKVD